MVLELLFWFVVSYLGQDGVSGLCLVRGTPTRLRVRWTRPSSLHSLLRLVKLKREQNGFPDKSTFSLSLVCLFEAKLVIVTTMNDSHTTHCQGQVSGVLLG